MNSRKFDFLVIGSGLAGLSFALKVAEYGSVCVLSKEELEKTNTSMAQGGIAGVIYNESDKAQHKKDTIISGVGLCKENIVEIVVEEAKEQINELIKWGARFDKKTDGTFDLAKEGGHSNNRILHHKDNTGFEIQRALIERVRSHKNIHVRENCFALEIITQHHFGEILNKSSENIECYGAYVLDMQTNTIETVVARLTFLATGGIGNIYYTTTNPQNATGDGIAMVYRAKGKIENMEFVQFHPTALFNPSDKPAFLITEAMRGFGGVLKNIKGEEFMFKYDRRGSLAPRDIVTRAIDNEMKISGSPHVFLDCTHLNAEELRKKFPNINEKCLSLGIDFTKDFIPVVPAAHYLCGGVATDENGKTSIKYLYTAGEVASTGLHGANRLASNSLLEAVVFANRAAIDVLPIFKSIDFKEGIPEWNDEGTSFPEEMILITQNWKEMQQIMSNYVGIVRSNLRIARAKRRLEIIYMETEELYKKTTVSREICELRNAINVGYLIIKMAEQRKESIGLHYNIDFPGKPNSMKTE